MTHLDENESLVEELFRQCFGFEIEKIPEGEARTADFFVCDGDNSYLIELKTRYRSDVEIAQREAQFEASGLAELSRSIERRSGVSKLLSEAMAQIESSGADVAALRLVFFLLRDFDADERWHNILTNLYGIKTVGDWSDDGKLRECYYFTDSDFFKYRDRLDAVIILIAASGKSVLCLNDHSEKIDVIRQSRLRERFEDGVTDPPQSEASGEIWLVDGQVDRSNEQAVIAFLQEKYSLSALTMAIGMGYTSATVVVPEKGDPK